MQMNNMEITKHVFCHTPRGRRDTNNPRNRQKLKQVQEDLLCPEEKMKIEQNFILNITGFQYP